MRKWIVRGLVFLCLGGMALAGVLYQFWTNPAAVRTKVIATLESTFLDVQASVESAHLRIFGGIEVKELRLCRKGALDREDFLYIPSATIFHDKEQVLEGGLRLRKVEIRRPRMRLVREFDGRWNIGGLFGAADLTRRTPSVIIRQGTLIFEDRQAAPGTPPLEITDLSLSLVNDPLPIIHFEGAGIVGGAGPVKLSGQLVRGGGAINLAITAPDLSLGSSLVHRLAGYNAEAAGHLRGVSLNAKLSAHINWEPQTSPPLHYAVRAEITRGEVRHPLLPWPVDHLHGSLQVVDGVLPLARLQATSGGANVTAELRDVQLAGSAPASPLDRISQARLQVQHFPVDAGLFRYLPGGLQGYQQEYTPSGMASVAVDLKRLGTGLWQQDGTLTAEPLQGVYVNFRYPVQNVRGVLTWHTTTDLNAGPAWNGRPSDWVSADLNGEAGGKPVFIKGRIDGERGTNAIQFDIWGNNIPIDRRLFTALPPRIRHIADNFQPAGQFDFRVFVRRAQGQTDVGKRFLIYMHDSSVCYNVFPLPLTGVSGTLDVRADSWEFRDFVGHHKAGVIRASGRSSPMPTAAIAHTWSTVPGPVRQVEYAAEESTPALPARVALEIQGDNLPIDDDFRRALAPGREGLVKAVNTFNLTGQLNFTARIDDLPNQPRDIDVTVRVGGCRMNPAFFPYPMESVAATVRYAKKHVWVTGFEARHGKTALKVTQANVVLPDEGGFWVRLDRLDAVDLPLDADLARAAPPALGQLVQTLRLDRPVGLSTILVIKQGPQEGARPAVYWDGLLRMHDTSVQLGTELTGVYGVVSCQGLFNGQKIEDVVGNVFLDSARVFNQPLANVQAPLVIHKESPDVLALPDLKADLFGGTVGGEGRIEFDSTLRYELALNASHVQLDQLGKHNFGKMTELSGLANAGIHLAGQGTALEGLKGHGRIDVPNGKLYRLPAVVALLKWLGLRVPDRTGFEQARVDFRIEGPRLHIDKLDLYGNVISVRSEGGSLKLDGSDVNLTLNADWARLMQVLPPGITELSRGLSNQLFRVKVHGKLGELKFEKELVPLVSDPLKRLWKGLVPEQKASRVR